MCVFVTKYSFISIYKDDFKCRVLGVPRLRVVDASILPIIPNANVNGPVVLVGEKAAEDIALDWSNS